MHTSNPVRSVRGFLPIEPTKFINVYRPVLLVLTPSSRSGYTCTHQHSPGCHCPVTSNQQHEPLFTSSLATGTIFFILKYAPLAMPKASYLSMESILIPILRYVKTSLSTCSSNCSPLFITGMYFCTHSPKSSLAFQLLSSRTQTASLIGMFQLQI